MDGWAVGGREGGGGAKRMDASMGGIGSAAREDGAPVPRRTTHFFCVSDSDEMFSSLLLRIFVFTFFFLEFFRFYFGNEG